MIRSNRRKTRIPREVAIQLFNFCFVKMGDFEVKKSKVLEAIYTGGDFRLSNNGNSLFSTCGGVVKVLDVGDGQERFVIGNPEDEPRVTSFTVFNNDSSAIVAYTNDLVKNFRLQESTATLMHQFRSLHNGPITSLLVTPDGETLLTGSPDFSVRVWQLSKRLCIHTLKGRCMVTSIRISSIVQSAKDANLVYVFSCDETMSIIDVGKKTVNKTVQTFEAIEAAVYVRSLHQVVSVGESGQLKFWDPENGRCILQKQFKSGRLDGLIYNEKSNTLVFSTFENNLLFVDAQSRNLSRCLAGNNDEILDVTFVSHELNCIAVATNSSKLKLYDLSTFSCSIFEGHTDNVMAVDSAKWESNLIASCSKDNSCILWRLESQVDGAPKAKRVAIATGHTSSVTGIRFCQFRHEPFVLSVSNDTTVKMWDLRPLFKEPNHEDDEPIKIGACSTFVAHTKDVTCVEVSSNDKLCVTGSMDKTAKLWHIDRSTMQLGPAGTLSGHRRGVWSAKFSNVSQTVATGSGDCTIKIFSLIDLSCQLTLEGHSFAVLSIEFINNATQLLSVDSNGLLKAWDVKSGVCEKTVECHEDKIWSIRSILPSESSLKEMKRRRRAIQERNKSEDKSQQFAMRPEEHVRYITAGSDGRIVLWEDVTEEYAAEQARIAAERMAQIQTLENFIRLEKFEDALALTLTLDHPHQCYKLLNVVVEKNETAFKTLLSKLSDDQLLKLMDFVSQWNTNTKTYAIGQTALNTIFKTFPPKKLESMVGFADMVRTLLPYTKRHFDRLSNVQQDIAFIGYVTSRMEALRPLKPQIGETIFKAKIAPNRAQKTPSMMAIDHFDFYYGPIFGKQWPSIRLGLLTPHKFVAVLNRLSTKAEVNTAILRNLSTVDLVQTLTHGKPLAYERIAKKAGVDLQQLQATNTLNDQPDAVDIDKIYDNAEELGGPSRLEGGLEEFQKPDGEITFGQLQLGRDSLEATRRKEIAITGLEHIGQELDTIDDLLYYPRQLQLFCYQRDDLSDFPAPIKDENGISSWWLLDGSSVIPVLALDVQEDDVVLDMCAAPGGKSLLITQIGKYQRLVCNDNKLSRLGQLRRALSMYIPITSEYNEKIVLKRKDASSLEAWDEEQVYDRVLVDVPCTTDRLSVNQDEQNIFAINTTQDRVNLPQLQTKLLINAIRAVKVGGTIVYSTCALSPQQNECVVENAAALVREHYDMDVVEVSVKRLENHLRNTGLYRFTDKCRRGMLIVPNIRSNFGPMFVCKLKRTK
ncbi:SAM-MT-RSMB-NOP domain-containing protein [Aphelenchoides besseyi]|nr:SAM-MT-RSMB-NOP domain-containing protein [Aphelenchoides besseyi]